MIREIDGFKEREPIRVATTEAMVGIIRGGGQCLMDMDGVLVKENELDKTVWLNAELLPALKKFEQSRGKFGVATARTGEIIDWLRGQGLQVNGPLSILANGQEVVNNGVWQALTSPIFLEFIAGLDSNLSSQGILTGTWEDVGNINENALVLSHPRWQSPTRRTYLIKSKAVVDMATNVGVQKIRELANDSGLNWEQQVYCGSYTLPESELSVLYIRAKEGGEKFDKVMAARRFLSDRAVFVTDFGWRDDEQMAQWIRMENGLVIKMGENFGIKGESDFELADGRELADVLLKTANLMNNIS